MSKPENNGEKIHVELESWMLDAARRIQDMESLSPSRIAEAIASAAPRFTVTTWDKKAGAGKFPCPKCNKTVNLTLAQGLPFNSGQVSMLAIVHKPARCEGCGREYVPFVTGGNLQCAIAEIEPESSILIPKIVV